MDRFQEGDSVRLLFDLVSDGTVYGSKRGELLVSRGATGHVIRKGIFLDDFVYEVHFMEENRILGCREHELLEGDASWSPPRFARRDAIVSAVDLKEKGELRVPKGTEGRVTVVDYHETLGYIYEVEFPRLSYECTVAESQILPPDDSSAENVVKKNGEGE